jgi:hypothetical protein
MNLSPQQFAAWQSFQHRILRAEAWREAELRERLARDEIAALMRRWGVTTAAQRYCSECNRPVEQCNCLPFSDKREVGE